MLPAKPTCPQFAMPSHRQNFCDRGTRCCPCAIAPPCSARLPRCRFAVCAPRCQGSAMVAARLFSACSAGRIERSSSERARGRPQSAVAAGGWGDGDPYLERVRSGTVLAPSQLWHHPLPRTQHHPDGAGAAAGPVAGPPAYRQCSPRPWGHPWVTSWARQTLVLARWAPLGVCGPAAAL